MAEYTFVEEPFRNLQITGWYQSDKFKSLIQKFEEGYAFYPKDLIEHAKPILDIFLESLLKDTDMELSKCHSQGSVYEYLKINSTPLEFDAMCVLNWNIDVCDLINTEYPGYFCFKVRRKSTDWSHLSTVITNEDGLLSTKLFMTKFFGKLQKFVNRNSSDIRLRLHGCAIKINSGGFDVDIVPGLEFKGQLYVGRNHPDDKKYTSWRKSTSMDELEKMRHIDDDGGCRRNIIRIFKALKDGTKHKGQFATLSTYVLKTAILHISDNESITWQHHNIPNCFIHTLQELISLLSKRMIFNYFLPEQNLLKDREYSDEVIKTIVNYLERLLNSEERMEKALSSMCSPGQSCSLKNLISPHKELEPSFSPHDFDDNEELYPSFSLHDFDENEEPDLSFSLHDFDDIEEPDLSFSLHDFDDNEKPDPSFSLHDFDDNE